MKVQRVQLADHYYTWLVLDKHHLPIKPIESFLRYLTNTEKSPNTIRAYANHLKLFWEYLTDHNKSWDKVNIDDFSRFVFWLRSYHPNVIYLNTRNINDIKRTETTVNTILGALSSFFRYHNQLGNTAIVLMEACYIPSNKYRSLLYHLYKNKPFQKRIISLKQPRTIPDTLSKKQISSLIDACSNKRDQFLISLLYETGLRIGQALSLKHEDIKSWDNQIHVIFRKNNINQARNKSVKPNIIHVTSDLMDLYSKYLLDNYKPADGGYVFVNYMTDEALSYPAIRKIFIRLSKKVGFYVTPHMLRHTHATELIRDGWDPSLVQKRLGHASIQTTIDTYSHISQDDLKRAFQQYQLKKESNQ